MKIVISLLNIDHQSAGIFRFGMLFINHVIDTYPESSIVLYTSRTFPQFHCEQKQFSISKNYWQRLIRELYHVPKMLTSDNPEIYIELAHFGPLKTLASVQYYTVIHDDFAYSLAKTQPFISVLAHRLLMPFIIKNSDCIITNSHATALSIQNRFKGSKIKTFYPIPTRIKHKAHQKSKGSKTNILAVGTIEPRKDYGTLIKVFQEVQMEHPNLLLTIVGSYGWKEKTIKGLMSSQKKRGIHFTGYCTDSELEDRYTSADIFISTSIAEGFGIPLAEAMMNGCACIVSDIPSFREIAEDSVLYFPVRDPKALKETLVQLINDSSLLKELQQKSLTRFEHLSAQSKHFRL